jgi:transmembrane sensor
VNREEQRRALGEAARWLARLAATPEDPQLLLGCRQWQGQHPANQWAWQRVEAMQSNLRQLPATLACRVLDSPASTTLLDRRAMLKGILLLTGSGALGWYSYVQAPIWLATHSTAIGERRSLPLADGTLLQLNTASAVDIEFNASERLIYLRAGEILLQTGADPRPLRVLSAQGSLRALGTRFSVRQLDGATGLKVLEHTVAVRATRLVDEQVVPAGMGLEFSDDHFGPQHALKPNADAWVQGHLVVSGWPLRRLLAELSRYRRGYLGCSDEVGALQVSGVFPVDDIDKALSSVARALPLQIVRRTRYWTRVIASA